MRAKIQQPRKTRLFRQCIQTRNAFFPTQIYTVCTVRSTLGANGVATNFTTYGITVDAAPKHTCIHITITRDALPDSLHTHQSRLHDQGLQSQNEREQTTSPNRQHGSKTTTKAHPFITYAPRGNGEGQRRCLCQLFTVV